ncbi:hypothetical protein OG864_45265 [Streptomyces sp. NBC_00124]|uniref:hypothetical protein n=1 Tax=Streptomyces sp. NBC_00124 TaxID=2975662 RepID=UPI002254DD81|nr:hypothetical protein [Streptomyces sp. NBC_00124]MCX5365913.1 hypothetical protein [Streptomyces sp. NBC_00124]
MRGQFSNQDRLRWQGAANAAVARFLSDAAARDLPAVVWTIQVTGEIAGQVPFASTREEQHAAFDAWTRYLLAAPVRHTGPDGTVHLYAKFEKSDTVRGVIRAAIAPEFDGGERS